MFCVYFAFSIASQCYSILFIATQLYTRYYRPNSLIILNQNIFQVWMFQRFTVVMEYERKPVLPPPIIIFCHIYYVCKWVTRNVSHKRLQYDNGLKLFLEKEDMERLYDFEEECVEGYFREQVSILFENSHTYLSLVIRLGGKKYML